MTDIEKQILALHGSSVTGTVDLKGLLETFGDTYDHIVDKGAGKAVKASVFLLIGGAGHVKVTVRDLELHSGVEFLAKGSTGTLDCNEVFLADGNSNAGGNYNRHSSYS